MADMPIHECDWTPPCRVPAERGYLILWPGLGKQRPHPLTEKQQKRRARRAARRKR